MRSLLIVPPGGVADLGCGADALILDAAAAAAIPAGARTPALYLRLGGFDDADALAGLAAAAALRPCGVALPGASGGGDVQRLGARLAVEEARLGLEDGAIRVLAFATETPRAVFGLSSYAQASARLAGLIWSASPLDRALGARRATADGPLRLARNLTLLAAKAAGVLALDAPFADAGDLAGLRAEAEAARADGFDGKMAIDPRQAAVINEAFGG